MDALLGLVYFVIAAVVIFACLCGLADRRGEERDR